MLKRKKDQKKGKRGGHAGYADSSSEDDEDKVPSEEESDNEEAGAFYMKFKEAIPPLVKKDMAIDDLWLLMKRPMVTN